MGFIEAFFDKNLIDIAADDVQNFISRRIEENQNLDYKDIRKYDDADDLSKHISSFANSLGGLLILGVSEKREGKGKSLRIYPDEITWGDETHSKETLENRLIARIQPSIRELRIVPIRQSMESARVIFLIDIPRSNDSPHMASDYRYYTRMNFSRRVMQHHEVANLFKVNWLTKEKLVEEIFEPLTSMLEKQSSEFKKYVPIFSHQIQSILANTYYKLQIRDELLEKIDHYNHVTDGYSERVIHARGTVRRIYSRTIMGFLQQDFKGETNIELQLISDKGTVSPNRENIMNALLRNESLDTYLNYKDKGVHTMVIKYPMIKENQVVYRTKELDLDKFRELIWDKCLREISNDRNITQMKKDAKSLVEEAWDLIEEIMNY